MSVFWTRNYKSLQKSVLPNMRMHIHPHTESGLPKFDYSTRPGLADWALSDLKIQSRDQMVKPDLRGFYARDSSLTMAFL